MAELLFELGTEELPSWYVVQAKAAAAELMKAGLEGAGLAYTSLTSYATPRRIAVRVGGLSDTSRARTEKRRGPAEGVAFDGEGKPTKAAVGFARASGVSPESLVVEETERGRYVFALLEEGGERAADVLPPLLTNLVERFPAPRKMRWADVPTPFVRPVAWCVALLDDTVLPLSVAGVHSGNVTRGHRFLGPQALVLESPAGYVDALETAFVLPDVDAREARTWEVAKATAGEAGLEPLHDDALLQEVAGLIEWPVGVLGTFDEAYLELPEEVLVTIMIHHQRFFPTRDSAGKLAPRFVSVSNNKVPDESVIREGYERVLGGRLFDARFFWEADRRKGLLEHAQGLEGIGFQRDLGTMADKVARVGGTARRLGERLGLSETERDTLSRAAPLFRADLSTQMVFELPELEGVMARAYALAEGYPAMVAAALEDGVKPTGPGAPLPASRAGALLAVADRADKLVGFFALGKRPTGSADPFGLRRDATSLARTLNAQGWLLSLDEVVADAGAGYGSSPAETSKVDISKGVQEEVVSFLRDRVAGLLSDEGVRPELVKAAVADAPPVITAARRAHLLRALSREEDFDALLTLYKRAANLGVQADAGAVVNPARFTDPHEAPLYEALPGARGAVQELLKEAERTLEPWDLGRGPAKKLPNLDATIADVLALKNPLDSFLDNVLVMVDDEALRQNRLALLLEVRNALRALGALEALEGL